MSPVLCIYDKNAGVKIIIPLTDVWEEEKPNKFHRQKVEHLANSETEMKYVLIYPCNIICIYPQAVGKYMPEGQQLI